MTSVLPTKRISRESINITKEQLDEYRSEMEAKLRELSERTKKPLEPEVKSNQIINFLSELNIKDDAFTEEKCNSNHST